jgi:hypothetical protein
LKSTKQDWSKLKRVLKFLKGTLDDCITLGADDITVMQIWVDASYAVHNDMKSHTGGTISFGRGSIMSKSSKQKLNMKSSIKAELAGASNYLPYAIWAKKFLEQQEYTPYARTFFTRDTLHIVGFDYSTLLNFNQQPKRSISCNKCSLGLIRIKRLCIAKNQCI